ncbi:MAG: fimbrillin family protein [Bacteroidales bacterium]
MKKISLFILALFLLASCSKQEIAETSQVEIKLLAGVNNLQSKAAIDAWANTPVSFAKGSATATYLEAWNATVASTGYVSFFPAMYYPTNKDTISAQIYLKGYTPQGKFNAGAVTFSDMNGTQDILLSNEQTGSITDRFDQASKSFKFNHCLTQLNFTVVADTYFPNETKLTSIIVNGTKLPISMNIASGAITYATNATPINSFTGTMTISKTVSSKLGTVMVEPGKAITLTVIAGGVTYNNVAITMDSDTTPQAGTAYTVALTFKLSDIVAKATIAPWKQGAGSGTVI